MKASDFTKRAPGELVKNLDGHWTFLPNALPPAVTWTHQLAADLSFADRALGKLSGVGYKLAEPKLLLRSFLRREAELSSRIENTFAGIQEMVLFDHNPSVEESVPDVREVDNNFRTLEFALESARHRPVSLGLIREMHRLLLSEVRGHDKTPGQFRKIQAHIGTSDRIADARFVPAPPHAVLACMEALEKFIRTERDLPPLVRLAMVHYQFEAIHPFADGNGRIGRVLILLLLSTEKILPSPLLNPSAYLERNRKAYYDHLLEVSLRGAWEQWIRFFVRGIAEEAANAIGRIERLETLRDEYQTKVRTARASALLPKLVDGLFGTPAITTNRAMELLDVKFSSAQKCIDKLVAAGLLHETTGGKRNRIYLARGILKALEAP